MKKSIIISIIAVSAILFSFTSKENSTWQLDKVHSKLGFTVTHLMVSDVEGWFRVFDAKLISSKDDFSDASVEMTAQVNSINTENEQRDTHLKSPDFFDAVKYATITFKSSKFKRVNETNIIVTGDLTMHGITKTIDLGVYCRIGTNPNSKQSVAGFKITGMINRSDFGIGNSVTTALVSDEVSLISNVEFIKN